MGVRESAWAYAERAWAGAGQVRAYMARPRARMAGTRTRAARSRTGAARPPAPAGQARHPRLTGRRNPPAGRPTPHGHPTLLLARARAQSPLLTATLLAVLLTTTVLTTLTTYSTAIGDASLRHALAQPENARAASLLIRADVPPAHQAAMTETVRSGARRAFDGLPVKVLSLSRSGPYALPGTNPDQPDLTYLAALDPAQIQLTSGRLPTPTPAPAPAPAPAKNLIEAALPQAAATRLRLPPGTLLTLTNRLPGPPLHIRITGTYRPKTPTTPYWLLDDLTGRGVRTAAFTTYGPLLTTPSALHTPGVSTGTSAWLATADFTDLTTNRTAPLRKSLEAATSSLRTPQLGITTSPPDVTTSLPKVLDAADRALLVSRSTLLIIALQLTLLAACTLTLVSRLLTTRRTAETHLLRARGASRTTLASLSGAEALLLAAPAVALAPLLSGPLTQLLAAQGPLARIGITLETPPLGGPEAWLTAAATALACALAVTIPTLTPPPGHKSRRPKAPTLRRAAKSPRVSASPFLRTGADLALAALAATAYWQLNSHSSGTLTPSAPSTPGSPAGTTSQVLGMDPVLIATPALALLAGTLLTLRLLPPAARLAERRAASGRSLGAALAGWQLSRRPARGTGPALLLVLAVTLGMLAIGQASSWGGSQNDQADFAAGAPVRVTGAGTADPTRTQTYAALPGVRSAAPAVRTDVPLSDNRTATVLALDTAHVTPLFRADLTPRPPETLLRGLAAPKNPTGTPLPPGTTHLTLNARLQSPTSTRTADTWLTLEDEYGVPYRYPAGRLTADGRPHPLSPQLTGREGKLTLKGVDIQLAVPHGEAEQHRLTLGTLTADGHPLKLPATWTASSRTDGTSALASPAGDTNPTRPKVTSPTTVEYGTGYIPDGSAWVEGTLTVRVQPSAPRAPEVTALATDRYLASTGAAPGDRVSLTLGGHTLPVRVTHALRALPTTADATGGGLLIDLRAANRALQERYGDGLSPTEWWLNTSQPAQVATELRALPDLDPTQVTVRDELADALRDDPFGAGPEAAFTAVAGAAAVLAALGFAVGAAGSLRERDAEFTVLHALGAPRRQLARTVAAEQTVLIALALTAGTVLGTLLTRAILPLIILTSDATRPVPDLQVQLPALQVSLLITAVAAAPALVTAVLAMRRGSGVRMLREAG